MQVYLIRAQELKVGMYLHDETIGWEKIVEVSQKGCRIFVVYEIFQHLEKYPKIGHRDTALVQVAIPQTPIAAKDIK